VRALWIALLASLLHGQEAASAPRIVLEPAGDGLVGEPLRVRAEGLPPGCEVAWFGELVDRRGRAWLAQATFKAGDDGVVDPAVQAPSAGDWQAADALAPLYAMTCRTMPGAHPLPGEGNAERVAFSVSVAGRPLATAGALRWHRPADVEVHEVTDDGLAARLFVRRGADRRPAVLVVGGSEGGIDAATASAELLAAHGHAALALAYFGHGSTSAELLEVPLEYFDRALDWLRAQPRVDPERIALFGGSKGGELVLLVASRRADVRAVVAAVPSHVVFQGIGGRWPRVSSWSVAGAGLPFVPYDVAGRFRQTRVLNDLYEDSLRDAAAAEAAAIPVEKTAGPILLVSGSEDRVWPSRAMCERIEARLRAHAFAHRVVHLAYEGAGHGALAPGFRPAGGTQTGGTAAANAHARADSWGRMLAFLRASLGGDGR
jgi:hypothetical protein